MNVERVDIAGRRRGSGGSERGAECAASAGARVALIDDNPRAGGQIWRQGPGLAPIDAARTMAR